MSIVLTHGYFLEEDALEQKIMKPYPPLGLLSISAYLEQNNIKHEVFDSTFSNEREWLEFMIQHKPKVIALYTNLMTKVKLLQLLEQIKLEDELRDTKILMGGPDVTYNWENYLLNGADFLVIGEGEETLIEFIQQLDGERDFSKVPGLAFKNQEGGVVKNQERVKVKDIDELPVPNRKKIDLSKYLEVWKMHHGKSTLNISTQRGCPYTCQWCSTAVYGQSYRRRSPKMVVDEIEELISKYNPNALWFVDDVFTVSHKWLAEFSTEMQKRNISIPFECITRAERMNEEVIQQLKSAGCFRIWIGAESGSQRIVDLMKRQVDINKVAEMMQLTRKYEIETGTFIMVGYPTETKEDIDLTIDYLKKANPDNFTITITYPIKGTGLYHQIEPFIIKRPEWRSSTDRDIDFQRTYPRKFYDYAVRRIVNEVNYHKQRTGGKLFSKRAIVFKLKSLISAYRMRFAQ